MTDWGCPKEAHCKVALGFLVGGQTLGFLVSFTWEGCGEGGVDTVREGDRFVMFR